MKVIVVIPARYGSCRFEGKVLAKKTGKYLVQHTYERAMEAKSPVRVLIATDDERVMKACDVFTANCIMTSDKHPSGTDRIAEAVANSDAEIVVNVQADEPEIVPEHIDYVAHLLQEHPWAHMSTLVTAFESSEQVANPNVVKVVVNEENAAVYFSRSVIPYDRSAGGIGDIGNYLRHVGLYGYRMDFLRTYPSLEQTPLEKLEKLEQLRALEHGYSIVTGRVEHFCEGIDTPEQYAAFVARYKKSEAQDGDG